MYIVILALLGLAIQMEGLILLILTVTYPQNHSFVSARRFMISVSCLYFIMSAVTNNKRVSFVVSQFGTSTLTCGSQPYCRGVCMSKCVQSLSKNRSHCFRLLRFLWRRCWTFTICYTIAASSASEALYIVQFLLQIKILKRLSGSPSDSLRCNWSMMLL